MKKFQSTVLFISILVSACNNSVQENEVTSPAPKDTAVSNVISYPAEMNAGKSEIDSLVIKLFSSLKQSDQKEFIQLIPTNEETELFYMSRTSPDKKEEMQKKMKEEAAAETGKKIMIELFTNAIKKGKALGINWPKISYDSTAIDSSDTGGIKVYNGTIAFSENKKQFFISFGDCFRINGKRLVLGRLDVPYQNAQNTKP